MKRINRNISLLLLVIFMTISTSCDKLLDVAPQNKLTASQFWLSKEQAVAALAGIYATANSDAALENYIYWGEMRGEFLASTEGKLPATQIYKENVDKYVVVPNDATTKFTLFYKIINLSNQAIRNIPEIITKDPAISQTEIDQLTGEAYFLRAFSYFWLVRTFKEVPLVLEPSETDNQDYDVPKSTSEEIFAQIIKDLDLAKATLPEWYEGNIQYSKCRATKYSALTMEADAYLWMAALSKDGAAGNALYQKVIENTDAVLNSGRYFMLHGSDMGNIFSNGRTDESIYESYANSKLNNQTNSLYTWFNTSLYFSVSPNTNSIFDAPDPDYRGATVPTGGTYPIPSTAFSFRTSDLTIRKYSKSSKDAIWNFYRLSEVILMKAEAIIHLYKDDEAHLQEALDLVNQVRERAFGRVDYMKATGTSTLNLDNIILDERAREFLGEGKRWFELVRFASRDNFANPDLLTERVLGNLSGTDQFLAGVRISNPDSWYLPLNADALAANKRLVQNPYYE